MFVCLSVGHVCRPCKNGWTDRNADWRVHSGGPKKHVLDGSSDSPREGVILGVARLIEKHCDCDCKSLLRCTQQKNNNGISATAAADCITLDWPQSHWLLAREKSTPCDVVCRRTSLTNCSHLWVFVLLRFFMHLYFWSLFPASQQIKIVQSTE